tara:strand:+ start:345 stop:890 length:546 start_codon:yes stop_codon:yes gene_type:complete
MEHEQQIENCKKEIVIYMSKGFNPIEMGRELEKRYPKELVAKAASFLASPDNEDIGELIKRIHNGECDMIPSVKSEDVSDCMEMIEAGYAAGIDVAGVKRDTLSYFTEDTFTSAATKFLALETTKAASELELSDKINKLADEIEGLKLQINMTFGGARLPLLEEFYSKSCQIKSLVDSFDL